MAARRLIILMLALLVASSVAAALVPVDPDRLRRSSTTSTTPAPAGPLGKLVRRTIAADRGEPTRIAIALGDQLTLTVTGSRPDLVEIVGVGELEDLGPDSPARFDLRPFEARTYPVRLLGSGKTIARIEVNAGKSARSRDDAAK